MATQPIDFSSIGGKPVPAGGAIDFSSIGGVATADSTPPPPDAPSAWDRASHFANELGAQINPWSALKGAAQLVNHPVDTYTADAAVRQKLLDKARESFGKGDYAEGLAHGLYSMLPFAGANLDRSGEQFKSGDIAGGTGSSIGQGLAMTATETVPKIFKTAAPIVRAIKEIPGAVKDAATAENTATLAGAAAGGYAGHLIGEPVGLGLVGTGVGKMVGKALAKRLAKTPAEQLAAPPAEALNAPLANSPAPTPPEVPAAQPAASQGPEIEDYEGQASAQTENAGAAPVEAAPDTPAETPAQILNKKASPAELKAMLNDALGGKAPVPLKRGVSLRNQNQPAAAAPAETPLPEGFTPVESKALKGYKYNPAAREFESITQGGQHYIHGDVSPEDAADFEAADSKGKAWQKLRAGAPLVGKVLNGQRVSVTPGTMGAPGEVIAKSEAGMSPLDQKVANLQDFIRPQKASPAAPAATPPAPAPVPAEAAAPQAADLTTDWSKALADVQGKAQAKQPANVAAARANPDLESGVEAAPADADVDAISKTQRIQRATQIIKDPESTFEELQKAHKDLLDAGEGPANIASVGGRAQAGLSRKMAQPRAEVEAPTTTRKTAMDLPERIAARKAQRSKL